MALVVVVLESEVTLLHDVDVYAKDQKAFFADFANAFQKLEELGTSGLYPVYIGLGILLDDLLAVSD